jgi:cyclin L
LLSKEASPLWFVNTVEHKKVTAKAANPPSPETYYLSEGEYQAKRLVLLRTETVILRVLGFNTHVAIPHTIALTYLQTMNATSSSLSRRVFQHLNASLFSPQLLYLTHQPNALAVAAIYLAAREVGVKLVDGDWWEIFDVDREDLGFLVVGMKSMDGFAKAEKEKWAGRAVPIEHEDLVTELKLQVQLDGQENGD